MSGKRHFFSVLSSSRGRIHMTGNEAETRWQILIILSLNIAPRNDSVMLSRFRLHHVVPRVI